MSDRREQALYVTLVDFLVQLIFLGLVVGVIYSIGQQQTKTSSEDSKAKLDSLQIQLKDLYTATGTTDIAELSERLGQLGRLPEAKKLIDVARQLESSIVAAGGVANAQRLIDEQVQKGQGKPSCLPDRRRLVTFHAYEDYIAVQGESGEEFRNLLAKLNIPSSAVARMTFTEFYERFRQVPMLRPDCIYNVTVMEYTPLRKPRDVVRRYFNSFPEEPKR